MLARINKLWHYLLDYKKNKNLLRIYADQVTFPIILEHYRLCLKYSNEKADTEEKFLSRLTIEGHSIEKGLANRDFRFGFGQKKIRSIVALCNQFLDNYSTRSFRFNYLIGILNEYDSLHHQNSFDLEPETQKALDSLWERISPTVFPRTPQITREDYFSNSEAAFGVFSQSRHSVRDFTGEPINQDILKKVFLLAQNAPSACNRQSTRVYCVYNEELRDTIAFQQNNAQGFVHYSNPIIVIATELQDWGTGEQWFGGFLDAGIYIMNLLYSLHYFKVAAIPLNWYAGLKKNLELHKLLNIPESQIIVAIIGCGNPKEEFKLATSLRFNTEDIVTYIQ